MFRIYIDRLKIYTVALTRVALLLSNKRLINDLKHYLYLKNYLNILFIYNLHNHCPTDIFPRITFNVVTSY